jgi:hypothetical protein
MTKAFDEIMKIIGEKGEIPDEKAKEIITEHGALTADEKKEVAAAIRMKKALTGKEQPTSGDEITLEDYMAALSVLDSDGASEEDRKKAQQVKDKFEAS